MLTINNVWVGLNPLSAADKFNVYAWCALGHSVDIYTHHMHPEKTHGLESLGLLDYTKNIEDCTNIKEKVWVGDLHKVLEKDSVANVGLPYKIMANDRKLTQHWLGEFPKKWSSGIIDPLYNLIDMCKSYLGATRQGIVLDLKVGPSEHLQHYEADFATRFISYNRGGQAAIVENQCMGTMEPETKDTDRKSLRVMYATAFAKNMDSEGTRETLWKTPNGKHYNHICGVHGRAWKATGKFKMDVTKNGPGKQSVAKFGHRDFKDKWYGPFRVLKPARSQTHRQSNESENDKKDRVKRELQFLQLVCKGVCRDMKKKYGKVDEFFLALMGKASKAIV